MKWKRLPGVRIIVNRRSVKDNSSSFMLGFIPPDLLRKVRRMGETVDYYQLQASQNNASFFLLYKPIFHPTLDASWHSWNRI